MQCISCGDTLPYTRRKQQLGNYCPKAACQRERKRQNKRDERERQLVETPWGTYRTVIDAAVVAAYLDDYWRDQYRPEQPDGWRWTWVLKNGPRFDFEQFAEAYDQLTPPRAERLEMDALKRGGLTVQADPVAAIWVVVAA